MDDANTPATKAAISEAVGQLRLEMNTRFDQSDSEASHRYNDIVERIDDLKTEILKAFYGYATGSNKRMAELEGNEVAVRSRLSTIEDRLLEVEKRLNMPPQAA